MDIFISIFRFYSNLNWYGKYKEPDRLSIQIVIQKINSFDYQKLIIRKYFFCEIFLKYPEFIKSNFALNLNFGMDRLHPQLLIRRTFVSLSPSLQIATFKLDPQIPRPAEAEESLRFKPQGNWIIQKMKIYFGINLFSGKILLWKRHNLAPGVMIPTLPCSTIF